ncbi:MAG: lytic transglycosylase domain-containing protein [Acidimicrobiales bacterium]
MIPTVPVPARVLEIQARFGASSSGGLGSEADAMVFRDLADGAMSARGYSAVGGRTVASVPPTVTPRHVGSVVTDEGLLRDDLPYADLFRAAGAAHGIRPSVLAAVAKVESGFDPNAVSVAGALGLMQFMPATAAAMGVDPHDPASAIDGAARYLSENLRRFGSLELALAAYNAGPGAVDTHGGIPPFAETQAYVPKVLAAAGLSGP